MSIRLFSTETGKKEELSPRLPGRVSMYVCGPTVYDSCHIGHARPAVVFDTIRRHLEYSGLIVTFISNITDIDDKLIGRSSELGVPWRILARRHQDEYERDMAALGVGSPTIRPRATEHIDDMLALISGLLEKGHAYSTRGGVWFEVATFKDYGRLSGRSRDDENTEHRVERDPDKRNPQDFALWKAAKPGEPSWDSPWGPGRPGWHIECSAMAGKYCDFQLDIHGGGADLAFPHHENELAQSEAFSGRRFVRHWLHNGFITVGRDGEEAEDSGEKMGKSRNNAFWLRDAFRLASPAALRLWILGTHYRMPLLYRPEFLRQAENSLERIHNCLEESARAVEAVPPGPAPAEGLAAEAARAESRFRAALDDDFNTPLALAAVHDGVGRINAGLRQRLPGEQIRGAREILLVQLEILGLPRERPARAADGAPGLVNLLLALRGEARRDRNFTLSDRIRGGLAGLGVEIRDRGGESTWAWK
ncbi:MAG: cysteine--tRNA ligase [Planctomycetota bacterium]|jgi:cysteinyl-tRNA synthetase|nr:cysteine--tRNA ligase [Planctomycetota bacterium]